MADRAQSTHTGDIVSNKPELTLDELRSACGLSIERIVAYVAEGVIEPEGSEPAQWRFSRMSLIKVGRAKRLAHDLGLNVAGVALALDLMAQIETLKGRLVRFEQEVESRTTKPLIPK